MRAVKTFCRFTGSDALTKNMFVEGMQVNYHNNTNDLHENIDNIVTGVGRQWLSEKWLTAQT